MRESPIRFQLDPARRLRTAILTGVIRDEDLLSAYQSLLHDPTYDPDLDDLVDLRHVERLDVTGDAIRRLADMFSDTDPDATALSRRAIVAPRDELFGLARMYQSLRSDAPEEVRVFRDYGDAIAWLKDS